MFDDIRRDLEGWLGEMEFSRLRRADPERLKMLFPRALTRDSLQAARDAVIAAEGKGDKDLIRRRKALHGALVRESLRAAEREEVAAATEAFENAQGRLPDGSAAPASRLRALRDTAKEHGTRVMAEEALEASGKEGVEAALIVLKRRRERVQELGARDARDFAEGTLGIAFGPLAAEAERFLAETQDAYAENLDWTLRRHGSTLDTAAAHDLDAARRDFRNTIAAPKEAMVATLDASLRGLGLDPAAHGRLRLVAAATPPTILVRRRVPADIILSLFADDGIPAASDAMERWGAALHAAHTSPSLPFEDRVLGDASIPRAWGGLLAATLGEPDTLRRRFGVARPRDAARELATLHLARARGDAGAFLADLDLAAGSDARVAADRLSLATLARHGPARTMRGLRPEFGSVVALRGHAGAAALAALMERGTEAWSCHSAAADTLLAAWSLGRSQSLETLLQTLGAPEKLFEGLAARFIRTLS